MSEAQVQGLTYIQVERDPDNPGNLDATLSEAVASGMVVDVYTIHGGWIVVVDESPAE